jgi:hypothetical protein
MRASSAEECSCERMLAGPGNAAAQHDTVAPGGESSNELRRLSPVASHGAYGSPAKEALSHPFPTWKMLVPLQIVKRTVIATFRAEIRRFRRDEADARSVTNLRSARQARGLR